MWRQVVRNWAGSLSRSYRTAAVLFLNTFILLILVNVGLYVAYRIKDARDDYAISKLVEKNYGEAGLSKAYPDLSIQDVRQFLHEMWDRKLEYDPVCQFKEAPYVGKWVNIDKNRFRLSKHNGPYPPDPKRLNIFVFGGSTTFGYGIPDDQTIASHLQDFLRCQTRREVNVYNFGAGWYYSTQERWLFCDLLARDVIPEVAVFFDGPNDFFYFNDEPRFTSRLSEYMEGAQAKQHGPGGGFLSELPMARFVRSLRNDSRARATEPEPETYDDKDLVEGVVKRYIQNKRLIESAARGYGVQPVFVWQPAPTYKYDLKYHAFRPKSFGKHEYCRYGYAALDRLVKQNPADYSTNFLWLADVQEQSIQALYVDSTHYSGGFCKELAGHVGRFLIERQLCAANRP
jgi:hypothetical protein